MLVSVLCLAGLTYSSGCSLVNQPSEDDVSTEIPEAVFEPSLQPVNQSGMRHVVFFDLETTGHSSHTCEIVQIAALYVETDEKKVEDNKAEGKKAEGE